MKELLHKWIDLFRKWHDNGDLGAMVAFALYFLFVQLILICLCYWIWRANQAF